MRAFVFAVSCVASFALLLGGRVANADLVNPSFELPAIAQNTSARGTPASWNLVGTTCYFTNGNGASGDGMSAPADGTQFAEIISYSSGEAGLWQNTGIPLQQGYTYALSFMENPGTLSGSTVTAYLEAAPDTSSHGVGTSFGSAAFSGLTASAWTSETVSATYTGDSGNYLAVTLNGGGTMLDLML